jgi:hypothetical protein
MNPIRPQDLVRLRHTPSWMGLVMVTEVDFALVEHWVSGSWLYRLGPPRPPGARAWANGEARCMSSLRKTKRFRFGPSKQKENERVLREGEFSFACRACWYSCFRPGGKHCPRCLDKIALRLVRIA